VIPSSTATRPSGTSNLTNSVAEKTEVKFCLMARCSVPTTSWKFEIEDPNKNPIFFFLFY